MKHDVGIFEGNINLELYYQFKNLIVNTTKVTDDRDALKPGILGDALPDMTLQFQYGFRYPGEVLEHYKDKGLDDIRSKRALLLALTDCMGILDSQMFNSNQLADFIEDMRGLVEGDIYILCALLRWDTDTENKMQMCNKIVVAQKMSAAAVLYITAMSSQYESVWQTIEERIAYVFLLHELNVYENIGVIKWLLQEFAPEIASSRRSCSRILKLVTKLQQHKLSQNSKEFEYLIKLGYTAQEIAYLNIQLSGACMDGAGWCSPAVMQNIVLDGVRLFITSDKVEHPAILEVCDIILDKYARLNRSVRKKTVLTRVLKELVIGSMDMFKHLFEFRKADNVANEWFNVSVLDEKWRGLGCFVGREKYRDIFENCLYEDFDHADEYMQKYQEVLGTAYMQDMLEVSTYAARCHTAQLVQAGYLDMYKLIDEHISSGYPKNAAEKYIHHFLCNWHHGLSDYLEYIVSKYSLDILHRLTGRDELICQFLEMDSVYRYNHAAITLGVAEDTMIDLFEWACSEICKKVPYQFIDRLVYTLLNSEIVKLPEEYAIVICDALLVLDKISQQQKLRLVKKYKSQDEYEQLLEEQQRLKAAETERKKSEMTTGYLKELQDLLAEDDFVEKLLETGFKQYSYSGFMDVWIQVLTENVSNMTLEEGQANRVCQLIGYAAKLGYLDIRFSTIKDIVNKLEVTVA